MCDAGSAEFYRKFNLALNCVRSTANGSAEVLVPPGEFLPLPAERTAGTSTKSNLLILFDQGRLRFRSLPQQVRVRGIVGVETQRFPVRGLQDNVDSTIVREPC
jgi:hypothetical protein